MALSREDRRGASVGGERPGGNGQVERRAWSRDVWLVRG